MKEFKLSDLVEILKKELLKGDKIIIKLKATSSEDGFIDVDVVSRSK